ncbi:DUF192 domain-containing protein [Aurantibacter crassamenti]|uniref:DUF192 domain-containing protein n=1 Tax=Aurantibacter crassamenti TaxID=1837375 RepID=UPI00193A7A3D|nr:DUF192 domain-containing protein [Aurantibacter crassamenti]MBM1106251.1 DUF192 domain-containing protein [Aurantibacter crassamenti]
MFKMNRFQYLFFGLITLLFIQTSCKDKQKNSIKTQEVTFTKEGELSIFKKENDSLLATLNIEFAENEYETQTGLMYRKGMEDNQGMLFIFPNETMHSFYMKNTEFPIDIIFIKADSTIGSFQENAEPFNENGLSSQVPIQYVLEVNAGLSEKWLLEVGDKIEFSKN